MGQSTLWGLPSDTLTALAAIATVAVALVAAVVAYFQVREARRLRTEQTQPFVVIDLAPNPFVPAVIDFTMKNTGTTLAKNVRFTFDPPLETSEDKYQLKDSLLFRRGVPALPPGKELRFMLDIGHQRHAANLPNVYKVTVNCEDARGRPLEPLTYICDLELYMPLRRLGVKNIHDLTKAVESVGATLGRWRALEGYEIPVWGFDGEKERSRRETEDYD